MRKPGIWASQELWGSSQSNHGTTCLSVHTGRAKGWLGSSEPSDLWGSEVVSGLGVDKWKIYGVGEEGWVMKDWWAMSVGPGRPPRPSVTTIHKDHSVQHICDFTEACWAPLCQGEAVYEQ